MLDAEGYGSSPRVTAQCSVSPFAVLTLSLARKNCEHLGDFPTGDFLKQTGKRLPGNRKHIRPTRFEAD